mmetsp:Transcript_22628/g.35530  ORF Transcript_22628/g.35530 Transcript_22628/m.35530 type:complete len:81 (-) Transcript_22628:567-809(-)
MATALSTNPRTASNRLQSDNLASESRDFPTEKKVLLAFIGLVSMTRTMAPINRSIIYNAEELFLSTRPDTVAMALADASD